MIDFITLILQEIEPTVGEALCKLFPSDDNVDLGSIVRKARKSHHHSRSSERHLDRYRGVSSTGGPSGPGVAGTASTGASSSSGPRNSEISRLEHLFQAQVLYGRGIT